MQLYDAIASLVVTRLKTEGPSPVDHELYSQLSYEHMLSSRYALHNAPPHGREWSLDRSAALLLSRMDVEGAMSVSELAEALDLDISTIHRQVAAAMKSGLVERIKDPDGGQARKHRPTEKGLDQLREEFRSRDNLSRQVTQSWTAEEVESFLTLLTRFNQDLESLRGSEWPRPYPTRRLQ